MKRDYIRKAIFSVFMLATLCQCIPSYLFDDSFHDFTSIELDIDHENESENENEEQNKKDLEEKKDKISPMDIRFSIAKFGLKNNNHFNQNNFSNYKTEILLPPPRTVA
ncbi:MAG: hypothetical protein ABF256_05435 [Candidatus Arcticimaribacter sp.]